MGLLGVVMTVQLSISGGMLSWLTLSVSVAQLALAVWSARRPSHRIPAPPTASPAGEPSSASIETAIAELDAVRSQRLAEAERLTAAIDALRAGSL